MAQRKAALVTGARRGIGRGIALALAEAGFDIVINDLVHDADAERTLAMVAERGAGASFALGDIADLSTHAGMVEEVYGRFGRLDCLVNNAGAMCIRGDLLQATPEDFDRVLAINLRGTFFPRPRRAA